MARAHVLKSLLPTEMLRARSNVQSPVFVDIAGMVAHVIGIVVIGNGVKDIYLDAIDGADHFHETIKSHPGIVVDMNTEVLGDGETAESYATEAISLVQLVHATPRYVDPEVTRD